MRVLLSALSCTLLLSLNVPLSARADDPPDATAAAPQDQFTLAAPRSSGDFVYGTHVSALDHAPLARKNGFKLMWAYVPWQQVEPERGQFLFRKQDKWGKPQPNALTNVVSAAADAGMKLILRIDEVPAWAGGNPAHLDPRDLELYLYEAVRYGKGTIQYVEVFNEPNLPYEWGDAPDPAGYARLLAAAYSGIKRADPNVAVISAAVSQRTGGFGGTMEDVDWLDGLYKAGAAGSFDLLGMHAYLGSFAPETDPNACSPMCFRDVERFHDVMQRNGDGNKQAFITEIGALAETSVDLGPYAWMELAPDVRADYLVRALQIANGNYPWIRGVTVFNFDYATVPWNQRTSEKFWFSLLQGNGNATPALDQIATARRDGRLP
jgi:Cellulase (glycosyl hydrolase family 5)